MAVVLTTTAGVAKQSSGITAPASGLRWRSIGPFRGGRVGAVAGAVGQPGVFYIGLPFGGVWKTTSAGTTWFPVFDAVTEIASIASITVALSDPNVVYAGTGDPYRATYRGNGIYKSADAGNTWRHLSLGDTKVPTILVDPKDPNIVVAAALGNVQAKSGVRGVFRSADGGTTWTRTLFVDEETGVEDIAAITRPHLPPTPAWAGLARVPQERTHRQARCSNPPTKGGRGRAWGAPASHRSRATRA
jgi:hypothetical protein